jgi:hypothetical protein
MSPTSLDPDFTQYKFVDDSNAIELEIEELTAKAVVLEESLDMIEADWKGKPMDKATLDVVTTLGLERSDIMRKLDSLQKQKRLMELERDRRNRTRIINKTLKAVTTRPSEAPDSPAPLPNNSVSNSDDFETDAASSAVAAMRRHSGAHETDASDDEKSTASTASTRSGSRVRHRTKVSRRRDLQAAEDESTGGGGASEDSSPSNSSQVVVKHRVRRPSSRAMSSPVAVAVESESLSASAPSASSPLKKMSGSGEKSVVGNVNHATLSSSGGSGSIVERLRAAAAAKEAEKKRLQESRERETTETK